MGRTTNIDFSEGASSDRYVTALARGFKILSSWHENDHWLTNSDISTRTGLPKPTVARLTYTLCSEGYLRYSRKTGKYAPGKSTYIFGINSLTNIRLKKIAKPYMQELADHFKVSVSLAINDGLNMVYIENCHSSAPLTLGLTVGARLPLAKSAMGHSYLFSLPEKEQDRLMETFSEIYQNEWTEIKEKILLSKEQWCSLGFATVVRDWQSDISGIGITLDLGDDMKYAFNVGGVASVFSREHLVNDIGPRLLRMIKIIEPLMKS